MAFPHGNNVDLYNASATREERTTSQYSAVVSGCSVSVCFPMSMRDITTACVPLYRVVIESIGY